MSSSILYQQQKFDWEAKREELLRKTNNNLEEIIKYVLNEKNTKITKKYIEEVFSNCGIKYSVNDISIFQTAMTHPSYINKDYREMKNLKPILMGINFLKNEELIPISEEQKHMAVPLGEKSYERLEFLGDSILRQIISDYLFIRYESMDEGDLTKLRSQIENGSSLAEISRRIGLPKYMLIPRNLEATGAREKNNKFQCDIFEAFIAAVYYDSSGIMYKDIGSHTGLITKDRGNGYSVCYNLVTRLIEEEVDLTLLLETESNHKDDLLQEFHKLGWGDPKYNTMETIFDDSKIGKKYFKMYVRDNEGNIIGTGIGSSKQKGEKIAAKKALQYLKVIPDDNEDEILPRNSSQILFGPKKSSFEPKIPSLDRVDEHVDEFEQYTSTSDCTSGTSSLNSSINFDQDTFDEEIAEYNDVAEHIEHLDSSKMFKPISEKNKLIARVFSSETLKLSKSSDKTPTTSTSKSVVSPSKSTSKSTSVVPPLKKSEKKSKFPDQTLKTENLLDWTRRLMSPQRLSPYDCFQVI